MIIYTKTSKIKELEEILELQRKNLPQELSEKEKIKEGFVTVKHTLNLLKMMSDVCPHTIAKFNNKVIGYALSMTKDFASDIDVLKPMFKELSDVIFKEKYIVMGQICIDKNFRRKGVFRGLYNFMKNDLCKNKFDIIITEIDEKNIRSLDAHESVGFKKMKDYKSGGKNWRIVSLKV